MMHLATQLEQITQPPSHLPPNSPQITANTLTALVITLLLLLITLSIPTNILSTETNKFIVTILTLILISISYKVFSAYIVYLLSRHFPNYQQFSTLHTQTPTLCPRQPNTKDHNEPHQKNPQQLVATTKSTTYISVTHYNTKCIHYYIPKIFTTSSQSLRLYAFSYLPQNATNNLPKTF